MTDKFTRSQSRFKPLAVDTPQMRAAVNLVIAVKDGLTPDTESLNIIADAFLKVFGGKNPKDIFGGHLGLVPTQGRQADYGITPSDVVSAAIELERRKFGGKRGDLTKAKNKVLAACVDIGGADPERSINRDWALGHETVEPLSDADLVELIRPYKY